ncbi:MAG: restriction endonuclease subunit M [Bacteroidales bacterium]|nr:restriction endonuclease subunit M [Clostridia bacterium]MCF0180436.1 restriction endonuclease subunit M [Bacteroidales bacterium]
MINMLNEAIQKKGLVEIAKILNININTLKRWKDKKEVPEYYYFELCKILGIEIDYSKFSYKEKDQFYTSKETAKYCINKTKEILKSYDINFNDYSFIEPSAGNGVFLDFLPNDTVAFDIEPRDTRITKQDFLEWNSNNSKRIIIIGNPPFGLRGHLALKFINHSYNFADFVCFILPPLFNSDGKGTPKRRVKGYKLIYSEILNNNNYYYPDNKEVKINTIFQIWTKLPLNNEEITIEEPNNYKIYSLSDGGTPSSTRNKNKLYICDIYLPSTCYGENNMKEYENFEELPQRRGYGIIFNDKNDIRKIKNTINWKEIAFISTNNSFNLRTSLIIKAINSQLNKE